MSNGEATQFFWDNERGITRGFHSIDVLMWETVLLVVLGHTGFEISGMGGRQVNETVLTLSELRLHVLDLFPCLLRELL